MLSITPFYQTNMNIIQFFFLRKLKFYHRSILNNRPKNMFCTILQSKLDGVALLVADPPRANSLTRQNPPFAIHHVTAL